MNRQERLEKIFLEALQPEKFQLLNESHNHSVPANSETHFKFICVSDQFSGLSRVERQRKVYALADAELKNGLHALSLQLFTQEEWEKFGQNLDLQSPLCSSSRKK